MSSIFSSFGRDIGMDIGTVNTHVYVEGRGVVLSEPSVVVTDAKQKNIVAVGDEAERMLLKSPDMHEELHPLKDGFIVDYRVMLTMIRQFLRKAAKSIRRSRVMVSVPCGITDVEKRATLDALIQAGAREAYLVETPVAAALGAGLPVFDAIGTMAVDVGGGSTDVAVLALGGKVVGRTARIGGSDINAAILQYIQQCFSLMVADETIEMLKVELASAMPVEEEEDKRIKGRDASTGLMRDVVVRKSEIYQAIKEPVHQICQVIRSVVEQTPPELSADIMKQGIVLAGETALLSGLGEKVSEELGGIPVWVPEEPEYVVARGLGRGLEAFDQMERFFVAAKNRKGRA
ncbi:MAG: rod shape-determining protein [Veillonellaceae bacterium]|nr:rod shape-determining protein [Veillonellaceae bacterium]